MSCCTLDGSRHAWLRLAPGSKQPLIAIIDDATKGLFYTQLCAGETTEAVFRALRDVFTTHGLPIAL